MLILWFYALCSRRVDRVCHTLVQTRQRFGVCPTEMRSLSLTVAVIERAMFSYGRQVQEYKEKLRHRSSRNHITHSMQPPPIYGSGRSAQSNPIGGTPHGPYPASVQQSAPLLPIALEPSVSSPFVYHTLKSHEPNGMLTERFVSSRC